MTVTVKLDPLLEEQLRRRAATAGCTTSEVIRSALHAYLDQPEATRGLSPHALGEDLFGRHRGPADLAGARKRLLADLWQERQARRG